LQKLNGYRQNTFRPLAKTKIGEYIGDHRNRKNRKTETMTKRPHPTDYAPYHQLPAFDDGISDYMANNYSNPYDNDPKQGVQAQAWDRGLEYAMRVVRHSHAMRCERYVQQQEAPMATLLIPTKELAAKLNCDLEGRLKVMEDDGLEGSPDHEDAAAVAQLLREQTTFPAIIEVSDAEAVQAYMTLETMCDLNDVAIEHLRAQGYPH
jgi:hypothetical protein